MLVVSHSSVAAESKQNCSSSDTHVTIITSFFYFPANPFSGGRGAGGSFLREPPKVRGQSNVEEVVFQGQMTPLKAWDIQVFSSFCHRLPAGPQVNH